MSIDASGKALAEHWIWAAEKGLVNANTARALRSACWQMHGVLEHEDLLDVRALDLEDLFRRFQNKRGKDFTPESIDTYQRRFRAAHASFLDYLSDPSSWEPVFVKRRLHRSFPEKKSAAP